MLVRILTLLVMINLAACALDANRNWPYSAGNSQVAPKDKVEAEKMWEELKK